VDGLDRTSTDVLVRFEFGDGAGEARRLTAGAPAFTIPDRASGLEVAQTYLLYGVEHIALGLDHIAFVLALLLLIDGGRRIVVTITAFTLAHSLTLGGAALGLVHVPGPPVEAAIALSIVFVASEVVHAGQGKPGLTWRHPALVAFVVGLLHGFGFAAALAEVGLPRDSIPVALAFFNVGVEIGQLLFIATVLCVLALGRRMLRAGHARQPARLSALPPYVIGSVAAFWLVQRVASF
jgi:hydrogenase/urease accessory protein HupE